MIVVGVGLLLLGYFDDYDRAHIIFARHPPPSPRLARPPSTS